jgi:hypothetical protein
MGNPTITRLGRTQIWYKKWYNDSSYKSTLKTTHTFENLLNYYFSYGLFFHKNFFYHNYWYKNKLFYKNNYNHTLKNLKLYFRKYYYAHQTLTIEHSYFLRLKTPEYFPLKIYILKYNNWLIASLQWFKPLKSYKSSNSYKNTKVSTQSLSVTSKYEKNKYTNNRSKLIISFILKYCQKSSKLNKYVF